MGCEQKGQGTALLLDSTKGSQHKGQSQLQGCVLKGKDVFSPVPLLLPASWNDDVKTGAGAVTLLHLAHGIRMSRMATPSKEPRSLMAK